MKRKASISHDEAIVRRLRKDPDFATEYLKAALEDEDEPRVLLIALRHLAQARGITKVAKAAGIERESLYRALSPHGNPRLSTLVAVTRAIGLRLTVEAAEGQRRALRKQREACGTRQPIHSLVLFPFGFRAVANFVDVSRSIVALGEKSRGNLGAGYAPFYEPSLRFGALTLAFRARPA